VARRPARDSTTVGGPEGLHLPGILPEPEVVEATGEPSESDRLVLEDLAQALPPEDREETGDGQDGAEPVDLPRPRAQLPWWYAAVFLGGAGVGLLVTALSSGGGQPLRLTFALVGLVLCAGAVRAVVCRRRG
jgi:hypothetical protein